MKLVWRVIVHPSGQLIGSVVVPASDLWEIEKSCRRHRCRAVGFDVLPQLAILIPETYWHRLLTPEHVREIQQIIAQANLSVTSPWATA